MEVCVLIVGFDLTNNRLQMEAEKAGSSLALPQGR
jgi:hypothetical protein